MDKFNNKIKELSIFNNKNINWYIETLLLHPQVCGVVRNYYHNLLEIEIEDGNDNFIIALEIEEGNVYWEEILISSSTNIDDIFLKLKPSKLVWLFSKNVNYIKMYNSAIALKDCTEN